MAWFACGRCEQRTWREDKSNSQKCQFCAKFGKRKGRLPEEPSPSQEYAMRVLEDTPNREEGPHIGNAHGELLPSPGQPAPGPWNDYLMPLGDAYTDWVREILRIRLANSVNWLELPIDQAVELAKCLGEATSIENVNAIIQRHVSTTLTNDFINEVGRLFRYWHGNAVYALKPALYELQFVRARSWYLYLTAAAVAEDECGIYEKTRTYRKTPSAIIMDAAWNAGEGLPVPEIN